MDEYQLGLSFDPLITLYTYVRSYFKKAGITATIQTKTSVPKTNFYHLGKTNLIQIYILVRKCEAIEVVDVMRKAKWQ